MMRTMAGPLTVISLFWYGSAHWQVTPSLSLISFTNSHVLYFFISFIFSLFLHSNAANILMFLILIPWYLFSVHILFRLNSDLAGYQFRVNNGVPEYKAGADAVWVPFSNKIVDLNLYSYGAYAPSDQMSINGGIQINGSIYASVTIKSISGSNSANGTKGEVQINGQSVAVGTTVKLTIGTNYTIYAYHNWGDYPMNAIANIILTKR